ncbi:hypothetical protein MOO46_07455 (plasmid) [Apilactobacillus apisilvae]|uniref:Phage protein n=1 Tax=Apilactobacillus apisilvae TaxID=2923364 RepID=A0ABY4PJ15_9LACO|nr:hypothetical protein [Apilactobacillus apisilvae]UQS85820.1 hypothetical protein MOO46_07455 [Apilactobacillus apisilvae]
MVSKERHIEDLENFKLELARALGIYAWKPNGKTHYFMPPYLYSATARNLFNDNDDVVLSNKAELKRTLEMIKLVRMKVYYNEKNKLLSMLEIGIENDFSLTIYSNGDLAFGCDKK